MLINCKPGCSGKKGSTTASLDIENNEVICDFCDEVIEVSSFVKRSMEQRGDIVRQDKRKSFQFECITCHKMVETKLKGNRVSGKDCQQACQFNISKFIIHAMKNLESSKVNLEEDEINDSEL